MLENICQHCGKQLANFCVSNGFAALKTRFSWFPDWLPKVQKCANIVDLKLRCKMNTVVYSCKTSALIRPRTRYPKLYFYMPTFLLMFTHTWDLIFAERPCLEWRSKVRSGAVEILLQLLRTKVLDSSGQTTKE